MGVLTAIQASHKYTLAIRPFHTEEVVLPERVDSFFDPSLSIFPMTNVMQALWTMLFELFHFSESKISPAFSVLVYVFAHRNVYITTGSSISLHCSHAPMCMNGAHRSGETPELRNLPTAESRACATQSASTTSLARSSS
jgi:hypothetical protein